MEGAKIIEASKLPVGLGLVVILISVVIAAISLLGGDTVKSVMALVSLVYGIASYLIFLLLFAWAGYRAVKKFGLDLVGAAAVGALSAGAVGLVALVLNFIVLAVVLGAAAATTPESGASTAAIAGIAGVISVVFGIFWIIGSVVVNAGVAAIGGLLAKGK
ncbi:MAG: hypothetical protein WC350_03510 [Candidatus Micrarchaeia archaeon]|jgi:hypothetical protein